MKIGISTACIHKFYETEDCLSRVLELGADACEVYLQTFYEYRPEFAKKYASRAEGVEVNSVHTAPENFESQLFCKERRIRGDGFYWLEQVMRSAQFFGAKNYTFHGFTRKGYESDNFDYIAERLRDIADFTARYGVNVCLENVEWGTYNRPFVFKELKARCPFLSGVFDIKHARASGYPYAMYLRDMQGAISHVHISDVDKNGKTCLPGRGIYNFKEVFERLKDAGFDGAVIIESANFSEMDELKTSVEFLKEVAGKI